MSTHATLDAEQTGQTGLLHTVPAIRAQGGVDTMDNSAQMGGLWKLRTTSARYPHHIMRVNPGRERICRVLLTTHRLMTTKITSLYRNVSYNLTVEGTTRWEKHEVYV
jgi:hypothetical protein